jgi:uncharacterized protein
MNETLKLYATPAVVLGIALIIASAIVARTMYSIRALDNTLTVTGSAKVAARATDAKWIISIERSGYVQEQVPAGYAEVQAATARVIGLLKKSGIKAEEVTLQAITSDVDYNYNQPQGSARKYVVRQSLVVRTADVDLIQKVSVSTGDLVSSGVMIQALPPEYYISNLPEIRVSLIGKAITDAKVRAGEIAKTVDSSVGSLKSASTGVVQVSAPNSAQADDYGAYDISTIEKEVMVTTRAVFLID